MHLSILLPSFSALLSLSSAASSPPTPPSLYTATLHALPSSPTPSSPKPLAVLAYHPLHPHLSKLESFTPPKNTSDPEAIMQVAIYMPDGDAKSVKEGRVRTSATATNGFCAPYKGRFRITVNNEGDVVGASWHAYLPTTSATKSASNGKGKTTEATITRGDFDINTVKPAPGVVFDAPTKGKGLAAAAGAALGGGTEGEEEPADKTFLQK